MNHAFGSAYFSNEDPKPPWHRDAARFSTRLDPMLEALGLDVRYRVGQIVNTKRIKIHTSLRSATQLGKGDGVGVRASIVVSNYMPPLVLALIEDLPDPLLWVLIHRFQLADTARGLDMLLGYYEQLTESGGFQPPSGLGEDDLSRAAAFLRELNATSVKRAEKIIERIIKLDGDYLGAYYFRRGHIELYWIPIWLVAGHLRVSVVDLATVVLIHEVAHLYTHVGQDASNACWDTDDFADCDVHVVEGLAQFYTEHLCAQMAKDGDTGPLEAFDRLIQHQPEQYRAHLDWARDHPRRAEIIRQSLVDMRSLRLLRHDEFAERVQRNVPNLRN